MHTVKISRAFFGCWLKKEEEMIQYFTNIQYVDVPVLQDGQLYIYILKNQPQGNIKIGMSTNMQQRLHALSGSNSGGNTIVNIAVSQPTYLYSLEKLMHRKFGMYRIPGTEWFDGRYIRFQDVAMELIHLFQSNEYQICNETRQKAITAYINQMQSQAQ